MSRQWRRPPDQPETTWVACPVCKAPKKEPCVRDSGDAPNASYRRQSYQDGDGVWGVREVRMRLHRGRVGLLQKVQARRR